MSPLLLIHDTFLVDVFPLVSPAVVISSTFFPPGELYVISGRGRGLSSFLRAGQLRVDLVGVGSMTGSTRTFGFFFFLFCLRTSFQTKFPLPTRSGRWRSGNLKILLSYSLPSEHWHLTPPGMFMCMLMCLFWKAACDQFRGSETQALNNIITVLMETMSWTMISPCTTPPAIKSKAMVFLSLPLHFVSIGTGTNLHF